MNITTIWNTLKATGSYTPDWTPGHPEESCKACEAVCEALSTDTKVDHIKGAGNLHTYSREGIQFMICNTYGKNPWEEGFNESRHYTIKTLKY